MSPLLLRALLYTALLAVAPACGGQSTDSTAATLSSRNSRDLARALAEDTTLAAAQRALAANHPWTATRLLTPVLKSQERRTPAALLLAARSAAAWGGWDEVVRLLRGENWLDTQFGADGRELLARAALERGDTTASSDAAAAVRASSDATTRAVRQVLLARALDRRNQTDSARAAYESAATRLEGVRDWLLLRAAGADSNADDRARLYARIGVPVARARVDWTEAQARERTGDFPGAAAAYAKLGAMPQAFRLRLGLSSDSAARAGIRAQIVSFVRARSGTADARQAVEVLDKAFPTLTPAEELVIARSSAESGPLSRAIAAYGRALGAPGLTAADQLSYGELLIRGGRYRDAAAELARIDNPANIAARAAYQRGRALLLGGNGAAARRALGEVLTRFPRDTTGASSALYLLGDLATDDGLDDQARATFRQLYRVYPTSARADDARFRAALLAFVHGNRSAAAAEFDSLVAVYPLSSEANAARYWAGRALAELGQTVAARGRWHDVIAREPLSYYAGTSARRLGEASWTPLGAATTTDSLPTSAAVDSAMHRIALLDSLGMDVEVRFEYDALEDSASSSPDRLLATAAALRAYGQPSRAIRLAGKAIAQGTRDVRVYRLLYPVVDLPEVTRQARARGLDPSVVAALIRQESSFNPRAVSIAGARGLMQVMPAVGRQIARSLDFPVWDPVLLFDPDANLEIGTAHLAAFMKQYGALVRVLAAYNAGGSRVDRWSDKAGADDPEIFAERIPFTETRDYVRIVQRNVEIYRALYRW